MRQDAAIGKLPHAYHDGGGFYASAADVPGVPLSPNVMRHMRAADITLPESGSLT
jgi:hypothetical protein